MTLLPEVPPRALDAREPRLAGGDRSAAVVETLLASARTVVHELDVGELARALASQVLQALRSETAYVFVYRDEQELLSAAASHASSDERPFAEHSTLPLLAGWVAQRRQLFGSNEPALPLPIGGTLAELGARHVLAVPALHHQGHVVAVLVAVDRRGPAGFTAHDTRLLEAIAEQSVVGFDRALLLGQLEEWTRGMEALLAFSGAVNQQREPATLVRQMAEHTACFLQAEGGRGGLVAVDAESGEASMVSTARWRGGAWLESPRRWTRGEGIPGFVLESEFPYLSADYAGDVLADGELVGERWVRHVLCVPIKNPNGQVLGFFELFRGEERKPFSWQDAAFLESLADTTAVAIENARLVAALAAKHEEVRALSAHHVMRLEETRQHIARELHDEAGQALVGVKLSLQAMSRAIPDGLPELRNAMDQLRGELNDATARLRTLARRLRPPSLDQLGLPVALGQLAQETRERAGFEVTLDLVALPARLPSTVETALFRITQEALTNAAHHSHATRVEISLGVCEGRVWLRIADDGIGFDPERSTSGLGLLGIRERVGMLGGRFRLDAAEQRGTTILIDVPSQS